MWRLLEPIHAGNYFAPESRDAFRDVGLKGYWMGYFAGRSAPMGAVGPGVVRATFYNFAPVMVNRAIPDAWGFASPADVLGARMSAVDRFLRRVLAPGPDLAEVSAAVKLLRHAVDTAPMAGRPIAAANAELDWPTDPLGALWQAATILREHRGDGHVAALCVNGLDGCEAHVTLVATGAVSRMVLQPNRGWSDEEWKAAERSLVERGWIDGEAMETEVGRTERRKIEEVTDHLAAKPWEHLGEQKCGRLADLLRPLASAVAKSGILPMPNPMGLPPPP